MRVKTIVEIGERWLMYSTKGSRSEPNKASKQDTNRPKIFISGNKVEVHSSVLDY